MIKLNGTSIAALLVALAVAGLAKAEGEAQKDLPGPIDSLQDLQDAGKMLFKLADENNDGQLSQKEVTDAGNLAVGGFFFRADANGDGSLTPEEARAARDSFLNEKPWLKYIVETVRSDKQLKNNANGATPENLAAGLFSTFDSNGDKKLEASEVRQGVQTAVQGFFATADTNRDGQISPSEVNASIVGVGKMLADAAFKQADKDGNGSLSEQEFDDALKQPVHAAFIVADLNHDGQISADEVNRLRQVVIAKVRSLRVPEPANSAKHLMESGRRPSEVAPVPTFTAPNATNRNPQ
jgi:Ca2+-binding EF-hand superfamily protein